MKITKGLVGIVLPVVAMYLIKTGTMVMYKNKVKLIKKSEIIVNADQTDDNIFRNIPAEHIFIQTDDELSNTDVIPCED